MLARLGFAAAALSLLAACDMTPSYVENVDIDDAYAMGQFKTVCVGVKMKDDEIRRYAAQKLADVEDPIARECVCAAIYDAEAGKWDDAILNGLKGSERDDMVSCVLPALDNPATEDRIELLVALIATRAPVIDDKLATVATNSTEDEEVRARAVSAFSGKADGARIDMLVKLLSSDSSEVVRAAAASALVGQKDDAVVAAIMTAAKEDASGQVRAAAMDVVRRLGGAEVDAMLCAAMIDDPDPQVRSAAVRAFKGAKDEDKVACLRKKAFTEEPDGGVRGTLLDTLKGTRAAYPILCDAIPFFMKTYITDKTPTEVPGTDIAAAQNDRDWDNSYACFQNALRSRGAWSCRGQQYVANWFREVGGQTYVPRCAGDEGAGEVIFE
ncbi:MAG: HEAT repeat domain-containing protein [Alphaproteobacteria bacterium]|nr:HEAT repeat domain-containing protein [Alphaproteobacteria bacterium]